MPINLIANVIYYKNKLVLGSDNNLIVKLEEDLKFFKNLTINNIVVMGRKTWESIPEQFRPLRNRTNIVLTNQKPAERSVTVCYMNFNKFKKYYSKNNHKNIFIIGGGEIYNLFLKHPILKPTHCWLTQVYNYPVANLKNKNLATMEPLNWNYHLIGISEKMSDGELNYRILHYRYQESPSSEVSYLDLLNRVLTYGSSRIDRTNVGTISKFGEQMRFDISQTVPLLTTKTVPWKMVIEELLWFMRGETDAKILQKKNIKIWDGNTTREFLDSRGLTDYPEGVIGAGYGWQWRAFGAEYDPKYSNAQNAEGGFDQLNYVIKQLKEDPFSRRILLSAWNPKAMDKMVLPPCHVLIQFYVESGYLSCHMYQRSQDEFLGCPFNIFSYTVLTYILAKICNLKPKELIISVGDAHIYKNHIDQVKQQLLNEPRSLPKLIVSDTLKNKKIEEITIDDFELYGYFPHRMIKGDMAV